MKNYKKKSGKTVQDRATVQGEAGDKKYNFPKLGLTIKAKTLSEAQAKAREMSK